MLEAGAVADLPPSTFAPVTTPATFVDVTTTTAPSPSSSSSSPPSSSATGPQLVDALIIAPEGSNDGYHRDLFEHWFDVDADGCDTRCEVLEAERRFDLPGLPDGGWLSIYDGYSTDNPSELHVDHVVALAEAWESGASTWDTDRRRAFANDLDDAGALVAVTAAMNLSKSDRDPASWQPPNRDAWCEFATSWVRVKARWGLTADEPEVRALRNMLQAC